MQNIFELLLSKELPTLNFNFTSAQPKNYLKAKTQLTILLLERLLLIALMALKVASLHAEHRVDCVGQEWNLVSQRSYLAST